MNEAKTAGCENRRAVYNEVHEQRKRSNRLFAAIQKRVTALSNEKWLYFGTGGEGHFQLGEFYRH
ncbi:MAG: hypothetical protein SFX19_05120, partial [Alphaproteobacteria bacterium]|nr:hypothetical protein [Alphaproteobacteria bacterium]